MKYSFSGKDLQLLFAENGVQENHIGDIVKVISVLVSGKKPKRKDLEKLVKSPKIIDKLTQDKILIFDKGKYSLNKNELYNLVEKTFGNEQEYF